MFVFDQIQEEFYREVFLCNSYNDINQTEYEQLSEDNENDLNRRLLNLISQMRTDNKGSVQPVRIYYLNEKSIYKEELISLLVEDKYRDEPFYVDFLAEIHQNIQSKLN